MTDVSSILAEHVHHETEISDMVDWYTAYPDSNVLNFFKLLMGSKNNEFSFFLIQLQHISGHPIFNLFNTTLHTMNTVILS